MQAIDDLRAFYATPLGRAARRVVRRRVRQFWPGVAGLCVLGLGYAAPYLRPLIDAGAEAAAITPPELGAAFWPHEGPGLTALAEAHELPFADCSFDRVLMVHAIEALEQRHRVLREVWRVLAGNGRLIVVAPNRRGVWARTERTPFGQGNPYSASQLGKVLCDHLFVPERTARCLYFPPTESRFVLAAASAWEEIGQSWFPALGGLTIVEASKQIYALPGSGAAVSRRRILKGAPAALNPARRVRGDYL